MKVTIAYLPEEAQDVAMTMATIRSKFPRIKMRESDRHPPFRHIYLTTKNPANRSDSTERA